MSSLFVKSYFGSNGPELSGHKIGLGIGDAGLINSIFQSSNPSSANSRRASERIRTGLSLEQGVGLNADFIVEEISVVYKAVAKVLASRLKPYLLELISANQSAFVPGWKIFDNVLVAFETLHSIGRKRTGKKGLMAIKLDMSKAYDRVEWSFLRAVMIKMNFPPRWIGLILDCISSPTLSILLNGQPVCKERVWKKLRGWKDSFFFFGGKDILIKAVAQAIPSYAMSIFQLPIGFCKELGAMFSKFWWGSKEGNRKISWVKWVTLCQPKNQGELGFKDLLSFNQSLLSKQAWRILTCPNSLVAQIFKVKYFKNGDFLNASVKTGGSHVWRSIVWGRSLLSSGLRWVVGDGSNISVFKDRWIPRPNTFKTITPDPGHDLCVADLLLRNYRGWDVDKLRRALLSVDKGIVLSIPISWSGGSDSLAWRFDKRGVYTVQSGYRLALSQKVSASAYTSSIAHHWWETFWRLKLPPKVKVFVWRACWNALPSLENLWKRKVIGSLRCDRCAGPVESSCHAIFWCKEVQKIWNCAGFPSLFAAVQHLPVLDVVSFASSLLGMDELGRFCMVAWAIWENRNSIFNSNKAVQHLPVLDVVSFASSLLGMDELGRFCMVAWAIWENRNSIFNSSIGLALIGLLPPPGRLKLNTAIVLHKNGLSIGVGAAIRDDKGLVLAAQSNQLAGVLNTDVGELIALWEGLLLALFYNLQVDLAEVVSPTMVSFLNDPAPLMGESKFIVQDIKSMFLAVGVCKSIAVSKSRNSLALKLALLAFSSARERLWLNSSSFAGGFSL
ncbi:hypothetical protein Dsin_018345 [Dipteronia sinensis]|uniref:Reverse transcriptase domain-containing protein n=1 Tax=Dipteronia sinensis TaxID=43782 RepID=A0AAE0E311_9ROSI|nr:hypothetical protein Dsin_018345 [Dipteronia sinensis]